MNVKVDAMRYDRKDINEIVDTYCCVIKKEDTEQDNFDKLYNLSHSFAYSVFGLDMFDRYFYLDRIIVKEEWRNKGIGTMVLNDIKRLAKEMCLPVFLLVGCTTKEEYDSYMDGDVDILKNKEKFYLKNGFSNVNIGVLKQSSYIAMCWCPPTCSVSVNNIVDKLMGWTM